MHSIIKRTIRGGGYFFASSLVSKSLGFLFIIIASRVLGPSEFGVLSLAISIMGVARALGSFGLPTTIQRFFSRGFRKKNAENLYGAVLVLGVLSSLLFSSLLFGFSSYLSTNIFDESGLSPVLRVFALGLFVSILFSIARALLQSQEYVKYIFIGDTVRSLTKVLTVAGIFFFVKTAFSAAFAVVFSSLAALSYAFVQLGDFPLKIRFPSFSALKKVLSYSIPFVLVGFSYFLARQTDRLMLGWLATSADVGFYTVSSTLALIMTSLHGSFVSIFKPLASGAYREGSLDRIRKTYVIVSKWIGSINGSLCLVFIGAGAWILKIYGAEFSTASTYQILIILSFLYFFGTWAGPTGALLQMSEGHKIELLNTSVYLVSNVTFNYIFILQFGVVGAAIGTLLSGIIRNGMQIFQIWYYYGISIVNKAKLWTLAIVIMGMGLSYLLDQHRYLILILPLFIIILTFKEMDREEKKTVNEMIKR